MSSAFEAAREFPILDFGRRDEAGVREAVEQVFAALSMPVFHYLVSITGNASEAEDLAQEVFLRLCSELRGGRRIENVRPWCFQVAHNLAASAGRRKQTVEEHQHQTADSDVHAGGAVLGRVEEALMEREQNRRLAAAMARLSPMERQSLHLRTEGLLYREIAEVLNVRVPTVQTLLGRAMKKIVRELHG